MAKLFLDLSKVKKMASDKDTTTFKHEDGHEIKVAHNALSPKMRAQLASLPEIKKKDREMMASGGSPRPTSSGSPSIDPKKAKEIQDSAMESGWQPERWKNNAKKALGLAEGGEVNPKLEQSKLLPSEAPTYADGGKVKKEEEQIKLDLNSLPPVPQNLINPNAGTASVDSSNPTEMNADQQAAANVSPQGGGFLDKIGNAVLPTQSPNYQAPLPGQMSPPVPDTSPDASQSSAMPELQEQAPQVDPLVAAQDKADSAQVGGANSQIAGIQNEAKAKGNLGEQEAKIEESAIQEQNKNASAYQAQYQKLDEERQNLMHDVENNHIDPEHYMANQSTGAKIASSIGLILGGIGSGLTGGPNAAMEMLKMHVNNDIEAQKANLNKKQSLLSENLKQFGNMRDAMDMTRLMTGDIIKHQLAQAADKAQTPIEKARAQQAIGEITKGMAPLQQQMAMRQALMASQSSSGKSKMDPAVLVNQLVPKDHQKEAFKEIQTAQNTHHMAKNILESFEQAAKDVTGMGRITSHIKDPRSIGALHQHMQPTFADLEGTVRQAAMDNTFHNITPSPYDSSADLETKRNALREYLQSKMSAPVAKSYGVDLSKFESTDAKVKTPMEEKAMEYLKKNPKGPISDAIRKKLGVQ